MEISTDRSVLIRDLNRSYGWELADSLTQEQLEDLLADRLNEWIRSDFNRLVQFLYRIDISEARLRVLLDENTEQDTGHLLARLVLERQWHKIKTRRQWKPDDTISDEERW
ncbi:MAG: hypothetical protein JST42_20475 [Bacteroidetes bacterium]|nr:hypothetical protein [Bacteroidota bacterium]